MTTFNYGTREATAHATAGWHIAAKPRICAALTYRAMCRIFVVSTWCKKHRVRLRVKVGFDPLCDPGPCGTHTQWCTSTSKLHIMIVDQTSKRQHCELLVCIPKPAPDDQREH